MPRRNRPRRRPQKKKRKKPPNKGSFRPGPDDRRHLFTPEEARVAGRKGGEAVSRDRQHMAAIGREGGMSSHGGHRKNDAAKGDLSSETSSSS